MDRPPDEVTDEVAEVAEQLDSAVTEALAVAHGLCPALPPGGHWARVADRRLELRRDEIDGDSRQAKTLACGAMLHDLRVVLAAHGAHGVVGRFPDPDQPALVAEVIVDRWAPVRPADAAALHALAGRDRRWPDVRSPTVPVGHSVNALAHCATQWGVHLGVAGSADGRAVVLWTEDDGPPAWLACGEALSALLIALSVAGVRPAGRAEVTPLGHVIVPLGEGIG